MTLKYLACSDIQFPLHDPRAVELWLRVLKGFQPDLVDIVGDVDNADSTSRWAEGRPVDEAVSIEKAGVADTRKFLADIAEIVPNADKHLFDGNHGWTRHEAHLAKNAPQFLETVTADVVYEYSKYGFEFHRYDALPTRRFNDMYVHHGMSVSRHAGDSVKADMDYWGVSLIRGHSHRLGYYVRAFELTGQVLEGYEIGHLMKIDAATYSNQKNWQQGFIYGYVDETGGHHHLSLVHIKDYNCWVDGVLFSA